MADDNTVFIGKKDLQTYVMAVMTRFASGADEVILKARGRSISIAVDVSQVTLNRFLPEAKLKSVSIGTEKVEFEAGRKSNVSFIEILLSKG